MNTTRVKWNSNEFWMPIRNSKYSNHDHDKIEYAKTINPIHISDLSVFCYVFIRIYFGRQLQILTHFQGFSVFTATQLVLDV